MSADVVLVPLLLTLNTFSKTFNVYDALCNFKNVKNTHGGVLLLENQPATLLKLYLNCIQLGYFTSQNY